MFKSKALEKDPEKDKDAAANAAEVVGRTVQQQQSVVEQPPEARADGECGDTLLHRLRYVDRWQHRMQWSGAGLWRIISRAGTLQESPDGCLGPDHCAP